MSENSKELDLKVIEGYNQIYLVRKDSLSLQALYKKEAERKRLRNRKQREDGKGEAKTDQGEELSDKEENFEIETGKEREQDSIYTHKQRDGKERNVFFRCGNWCYEGNLHFKSTFNSIQDVPQIIPELQRHQNELGYYCTAENLSEHSPYYHPLSIFTKVLKNLEQEVCGDEVTSTLAHWENSMSWISEIGRSYFELELAREVTQVGGGLEEIELLVSKTYYDSGLIMISLYYSGSASIYSIVLEGQGEHPLLDVRFPDISVHGQGLHLSTYSEREREIETNKDTDNKICRKARVPRDYDLDSVRILFRKLTLWEAKTDMEPLTLSPSEMILQQQQQDQEKQEELKKMENIRKQEEEKRQDQTSSNAQHNSSGYSNNNNIESTKAKERQNFQYNIASTNYIQAYLIMKPDHYETLDIHPTSMRHVLFRFGSWCYSGCIELCPRVLLKDLPFLIPALRLQQHKLAFFSDVNTMPKNSSYATSLQHLHTILPSIEDIILRSEDSLLQYHEMMAKMGEKVDAHALKWLDDDELGAFFEFCVDTESELENGLDDVELLCCKVYKPQGLCLFLIYFEHRYYALLKEAEEEQPLLDSRFPTVANRGRGYQLFQFGEGGVPGWDTLRKVSVWENGKEEVNTARKEGQGETQTQTLQKDSQHVMEKGGRSEGEFYDNYSYGVTDKSNTASKSANNIGASDNQRVIERERDENRGNDEDEELKQEARHDFQEIGNNLSNMTLEERKKKKEKTKPKTNSQKSSPKPKPKDFPEKELQDRSNNSNKSDKITAIVKSDIDGEECVVVRRKNNLSTPKGSSFSFSSSSSFSSVNGSGGSVEPLAPLGGGVKMNLGGLHHLKPLSEKDDGPGVLGLKGKLKALQEEQGLRGDFQVAPWDLRGKPILGKTVLK